MNFRAWIHMVVGLGLLLSPWAGGLRLRQPVQAAPAGTIRYVKPGGTGACSAWDDACELQAALRAAQAGDQIWVAKGVYKPTHGITHASCAQIHSDDPDAPDGEYLINVAGNVIQVYCSNMASTPREYLTLSGDNFAQYTAGGASPGENVHTTYTRVRLLPDTMQVDIGDLGYSSSTGELTLGSSQVISMPYAVAADCLALSSSTGEARIDLRDTPFAISGSETFIQCGYYPAGSASLSEQNQVVELTGGGYCGWTQPGPACLWDTLFNDPPEDLPILELSYLHPEQRAAFRLANGVELYGGFDPDSGVDTFEERDPAAYPTVLSGDIDDNDLTDPSGVVTTTTNLHGYNSFHVVMSSNVDASAALEGFTITAGKASGWDPEMENSKGGGMYNDHSSPHMIYLTFSGNFAISGGGMYNLNSNSQIRASNFIKNTATSGGGVYNDSSSPVMWNMTFSNNSATQGGGMYNTNGSSPYLGMYVTFSNNSATEGGGLYNDSTNPSLYYATFSHNSANNGGGIYNNNSSPTIRGVTFTHNTATNGGGIYNNSSSPTLTVNPFPFAFEQNSAQNGGGMYNLNSNPVVENLTFHLNRATNGAGMYNDNSSPSLTGVIFDNNVGEEKGGGMCNINSSPALEKVIFKDNWTGLAASWAGGGGMYNAGGSPSLSSVTFFNNFSRSQGGGMCNTGSSPALTNVTFSANDALFGGGAMHNTGGSSPTLTNVTFGGDVPYQYSGNIVNEGASLTIRNSILWSDYTPQISNNSGVTLEYSMIKGGCDSVPDVNCSNEVTGDPQFISGFNLGRGSAAIDGGNNAFVPPEITEDQNGNPRFFADDADLDGGPDADATVDLGAYEAQYGWYMTYGDERLSAGRAYRTGFHVSSTISDTLAAYSVQPFLDADRSYSLAPGRVDTPAEVTLQDIVILRLDARWEIATGELLVGNDEILKTQDMRFSAALPSLENHITRQVAAQEHFSTGVLAYLALLDDQASYDLFLSAQPDRTSYLDLADPQPNPYHDVQRLAQAAARESLAYVTLAESYFRQNTVPSKELAEETLRAGHDRAGAMLALLERLARDWEGAQENTAYATGIQALTQNIAEMERIFEYLQQGTNPFGYHDGYLPFMIRYDNSSDPETIWNFLNIYEEAYNRTDSYFHLAEEAHEDLMEVARQLDDDQAELSAALLELAGEYEGKLVKLCGVDGAEIDLADCAGGDIRGQILVIQEALTRLQQAELEMANQLELVRIEQQRAAEVAGIHNATAIMYTQDGRELASLARDEANLRYSKSDTGMALDILSSGVSGFLGGAELGTNFNPVSGLLFGGLNMILQAGKNLEERETARKLGDIAAKRERIDARQKARVEYAEAEIVDANSEALIKEYFLEYATLELDRAIAYNALQQELHRLKAMTSQVEYLLARWSEAKRDVFEVYYDPGARLYRDSLSEDAHEKYDQALEWAFRSGRALDYEMGESWVGADDIFEIVEINTLGDAFIQMNTDFNNWKPSIPPEPAYTAIPLSQVLGFADSWEIVEDVPVYTTARDKFNAYVGDRANWVDLDGDGTAGSLRLTFQTSIFNSSEGLNLFSTGVFNDKILRVAPVLVGNAGHLDPGDDNTSVRIKQLGTCYLRSKDAVIGGQDSFKAYDFEHAIRQGEPREARLNSYHEWINQESLAASEIDTRGSLGLLWRSVGCTDWVLTIAKEGIDADNSDIDFAYLEDILLFVKHRNFALETPKVAASSTGQLDAQVQSAPRLMATADAAYRYSGTLLPEQPEQMRPEQLTLYLEQSGGAVAGVVEAGGLLGFPELDESGTGPALTGTVADGKFHLDSEIYRGAGGITRTLTLTTTAVYTDGALIRGEYTQAILGLVPETIQVHGTFTLTQAILTPQASFGAKPSTGPAPLEVEFLDWSVGNPVSWAWDFGDGAASAQQRPIHTFEQPGLYAVSLTVSNLFGTHTLTETDYILVTEPAAPVAYFAASPTSGPVPLTVTFTDSSAGGPTSWAWEFGDGGSSTEQDPMHIYTAVGTYTVTLTVSNTVGSDTAVMPDYVTVDKARIYLPLVMRSAHPPAGEE